MTPPLTPPGGSRSQRPTPVPRAASFCALGSEPLALAAAIREAHAGVPVPSGAIVFASGSVRKWQRARSLRPHRARRHSNGARFESGRAHRRAEHEGFRDQRLVGSGGTVTPMYVPPKTATDQIGPRLPSRSRPRWGRLWDGRSACAAPGLFAAHVGRARRFSAHATVLGAGNCPAGLGIFAGPAGTRRSGGPHRSRRGASCRAYRVRCRLLSPFMPIKEARGAMVFRPGDEPSFRCSRRARAIRGAPAGARGLGASRNEGRRTQRHPVRGIGASIRGASRSWPDEASPGMLMTFAVCDAARRAPIRRSMRELARDMAGAAPQFGLLMSCAGRGVDSTASATSTRASSASASPTCLCRRSRRSR